VHVPIGIGSPVLKRWIMCSVERYRNRGSVNGNKVAVDKETYRQRQVQSSRSHPLGRRFKRLASGAPKA